MLPTPKQAIRDVAVEELKVPDKLYQAESFYVEVMIRSTFKTSGEPRIYEDNREIGRERVDVTPGENRYAVKGLAKSPDFTVTVPKSSWTGMKRPPIMLRSISPGWKVRRTY